MIAAVATSFTAIADSLAAAGVVIAEDELGISQGTAWAFAYWGGDFYVFTSFGSGSRVTRFNTTTKAIATVANFTTGQIVGAGVSTCAPQK